MAGISLLSRPYTYTTSVAATVSAIVGDTAVSQSQVFFTDGTDGYVYIKGAGTGTSYDGTLIKLLALKTLPTSVIKGTVIDGYIAGATLYVDVNGNGIADATESTGIKTDANGNFSLETTMVGPLIAVGGTNVDTGLPNSLTLSAPRGSTVITPITSLVQGLVSGTGATIAEAEELVQSKLGIQGAVDLTQFDALKAGSDPTIALKVQQTAAQLAELGTLAEGAGSDFAKVITAIGDAINSNQTINLVGRESLDTVLGKVLNTSQLDKAISITQDIAATTSTQSISTVQLRVSNNNVGAGGVSISGTPTQGQALNATNTLTDADGLGAISYQWNADGIAVPLATGATFLPEQPQVGKVITVTASYVDGKGNTEAFTSAATTKVVNVNDAPTGSITIQGTAAELQVLTAVSTLADLDGLGTLSYQWLRADNPIANATASTYILQQSDVGSAVRVRISYTDGLSAVESVTSSPTASIAGVSKTLLGTTNNDAFTGGLGDDTIDGGAGIDTANYIGSRTNFTLLKAAANFVAADLSGKEGTDTLTSIERINFADKKLALDLAPTQHAGQTVLLLGLLSPSTLLSPAIVGGVLALFDSGLTLRDVCQLALDAGVVSNIAGSSSNLDLATLAAKNLTGVTEAATVDLLLSFLDGRNAALSQTDFLTIGASLDINQLQVNLVGLQSTGIDFS